MLAKNWQLGGESSGHIICRDTSTTGDGIVSALKVLKAMRSAGKSLAEMVAGIQLYPQTMINVRVQQKRDTDTIPAIVAAVQQAERDMAGKGRVLLRASGTEPLIRVMVEGEDAEQVQTQAEKLAKVVVQEMC